MRQERRLAGDCPWVQITHTGRMVQLVAVSPISYSATERIENVTYGNTSGMCES